MITLVLDGNLRIVCAKRGIEENVAWCFVNYEAEILDRCDTGRSDHMMISYVSQKRSYCSQELFKILEKGPDMSILVFQKIYLSYASLDRLLLTSLLRPWSY